MAGSFSNWGENAVLDSVFGGSTEMSTSVANWYVSLWESTADTAVSGDALTGADTGECPGSTYARVAIANTSANWANCTGGVKLLKVACTMTTAAGADWGTIGYICLGTSGTTGGQILVWSSITGGAKVINSGDTVIVTTGFSITLT